MTDAALDDTFTAHKFRKLNRNFWRALRRSYVYFASPDGLNDPFDCQIDLVKAFRLAKLAQGSVPAEADLALWDRHARRIMGLANDCGVFCLCAGDIRGPGERLMWSHYADNHRGVCLTYTIPYSFVLERGLVGCAPVEYDPGPLLDALRRLDLSKRQDFDADITPVITSLLTAKEKEWAYETETRLVSEKAGQIQFDQSWLKQVCFGLRTTANDRTRVMEEVRKAGYADCGFAELIHSDAGLFELETREVVSQS